LERFTPAATPTGADPFNLKSIGNQKHLRTSNRNPTHQFAFTSALSAD
jgi:hypothetical protein